jgi:hypothetical protein
MLVPNHEEDGEITSPTWWGSEIVCCIQHTFAHSMVMQPLLYMLGSCSWYSIVGMIINNNSLCISFQTLSQAFMIIFCFWSWMTFMNCHLFRFASVNLVDEQWDHVPLRLDNGHVWTSLSVQWLYVINVNLIINDKFLIFQSTLNIWISC